jgi:saxitoxin biosynthesis operon SxtJ-like protein
MKGNSHESFESHVPEKMGSERSFGYVVGGILLVIALWPLHAGNAPHWWALVPAVPLLALAAIKPSLLAPLNKLWFKLGILMGRIISPIVLGIVYFLWITPIALVMRMAGKKFLALDFESRAKSYWIIREPAKAEASVRLRRPY